MNEYVKKVFTGKTLRFDLVDRIVFPFISAENIPEEETHQEKCEKKRNIDVVINSLHQASSFFARVTCLQATGMFSSGILPLLPAFSDTLQTIVLSISSELEFHQILWHLRRFSKLSTLALYRPCHFTLCIDIRNHVNSFPVSLKHLILSRLHFWPHRSIYSLLCSSRISLESFETDSWKPLPNSILNLDPNFTSTIVTVAFLNHNPPLGYDQLLNPLIFPRVTKFSFDYHWWVQWNDRFANEYVMAYCLCLVRNISVPFLHVDFTTKYSPRANDSDVRHLIARNGFDCDPQSLRNLLLSCNSILDDWKRSRLTDKDFDKVCVTMGGKLPHVQPCNKLQFDIVFEFCGHCVLLRISFKTLRNWESDKRKKYAFLDASNSISDAAN